MAITELARSMSLGAEVHPNGTHFCVFVPTRTTIEVVLERDRVIALQRDGNGHFAGFVEGATAGSLYKYDWRVTGTIPIPLPGFSPLVPTAGRRLSTRNHFPGQTKNRGVRIAGQILYEMHIGT